MWIDELDELATSLEIGNLASSASNPTDNSDAYKNIRFKEVAGHQINCLFILQPFYACISL